jgi:deaminated glutathione amidase
VPALTIATCQFPVSVDTGLDLYDSTVAWRERAMAGVLHSGTLVRDPRSADRTSP